MTMLAEPKLVERGNVMPAVTRPLRINTYSKNDEDSENEFNLESTNIITFLVT
jgi:hypothetical protein